MKKHNPTWEHIKLLAWVILIIELLVFWIALIAGRNADYRYAFNVCFWIGLIIALVFLSIFLLNLLGIMSFAFFSRIRELVSTPGKKETQYLNIFDFPQLKPILKHADHVDVKTVEGGASLSVFIAAMLSYRPDWLLLLYRIRKIFVRVLGMKQEEVPEMLPHLNPEDVSFQPGNTTSFFIVRHADRDLFWIAKTPEEKHLRAFFCIFKKKLGGCKNRFYIMTIVHYKHWTGPVYFNVIRPFHHLVVKQMAIAGVKQPPSAKAVGLGSKEPRGRGAK